MIEIEIDMIEIDRYLCYTKRCLGVFSSYESNTHACTSCRLSISLALLRQTSKSPPSLSNSDARYISDYISNITKCSFVLSTCAFTECQYTQSSDKYIP